MSLDYFILQQALLDSNTEDRRILYEGRELPVSIQMIHSGKEAVWLKEDAMILYLKDTQNTVPILKKWYKKQASLKLTDRLNFFAESLSLEYNRVAYKDQKSRWGSCSSKKNINLNYRLLMAPSKVADYVIIHELCHLKHMDHSKEFWNMVSSCMPDYKECRSWLKKNVKRMSFLGA